MVRTSGGGKPPPYAVGTDRPVRWFSACTGGGTHRSRPTNHMGSPFVFVGRHLRVPPCGGGVDDRHIPANPYTPIDPPPAGLGGLWPSHRNNAKHGLSALPHFLRTTESNHKKISKSQI